MQSHSDVERAALHYLKHQREVVINRPGFVGNSNVPIAELLEPVGKIPPTDAKDQYYADAQNIDMAA
jgi:hypothetical protein